MRGTDYYKLLGVAEDASAAEIKSAYRALVRSTHPDTGGSVSTFQRLRDAYETLHDPASRARYDQARAMDNVARRAPARRVGATRRTPGSRRVGEDPAFVPPLPRISPDAIPWWYQVDPTERVRTSGQQPPGHAPLVVVFGGLLVLLIPVALPVEFVTMLAVWLLVALLTGGCTYWLARRLLATVRIDRKLRAEFGEAVEHGKVGDEPDQWNERLTAELLARYLSGLPAARIFHGLALPGSVFADVDHAVLRGGKLVLIESKAWLPGHYSAQGDGSLLRNGQRFRGGASHLDEAVTAYRDLLPDTEVRGALLLYPSRAGTLSTADAPQGTPIAPMTPEQLVRDIGAWLADEPATVDITTLRDVLRQIV